MIKIGQNLINALKDHPEHLTKKGNYLVNVMLDGDSVDKKPLVEELITFVENLHEAEALPKTKHLFEIANGEQEFIEICSYEDVKGVN